MINDILQVVVSIPILAAIKYATPGIRHLYPHLYSFPNLDTGNFCQACSLSIHVLSMDTLLIALP